MEHVYNVIQFPSVPFESALTFVTHYKRGKCGSAITIPDERNDWNNILLLLIALYKLCEFANHRRGKWQVCVTLLSLSLLRSFYFKYIIFISFFHKLNKFFNSTTTLLPPIKHFISSCNTVSVLKGTRCIPSFSVYSLMYSSFIDFYFTLVMFLSPFYHYYNSNKFIFISHVVRKYL